VAHGSPFAGCPVATQRRDQCQDTASRFVGQCEDNTDWIGLCWASLRRPVGTYGDIVQWAASGGHHPSCQRASTRSFHNELWVRWNRNRCWVILAASHRHPPDPPVVRAEAAPDPLGPPPLASKLEPKDLLNGRRHRTGQYQPQSGQRIIRVFSASLSGDRGRTAAAAEGPWSCPSVRSLQGLSQTASPSKIP
jgi:hypothetical protein